MYLNVKQTLAPIIYKLPIYKYTNLNQQIDINWRGFEHRKSQTTTFSINSYKVTVVTKNNEQNEKFKRLLACLLGLLQQLLH